MFLQSAKLVIRYRHFLAKSVLRNIKQDYDESYLGIFWLTAKPVTLIFIYSVIFSKLMKARFPVDVGDYSYSIYLCAGIIPWLFHEELLNNMKNVYFEYAGYIKKLKFPKTILPLIILGSSSIRFMLFFVIFVIFLALVGHIDNVNWNYFILAFLIQILLSFSLGLLLAVVNIFVRDISNFLSIFLQLWFWLTPIIYPANILPPDFLFLFQLNPFFGIVDAYHQAIFFGNSIELNGLAYPVTITLAVCFTALITYKRLAPFIGDRL